MKNNIYNKSVKPYVQTDISFDHIKGALLINNSKMYSSPNSLKQDTREKENAKTSVFNENKAFKPLLAGTVLLAGGCFAMSTCLKKASNSLLNTKNFEHLPDLAVNMNIKEEPQFAVYKAVREPHFRNIAAAGGVFLMSGITIACKNFIDGLKEIWIKKQHADIETNLQENLITVERDVFSGKLKIVNDLMKKNIEYFENVINDKQKAAELNSSFKSLNNMENIFTPLETHLDTIKIPFKGKRNPVSKNSSEESRKNLKYLALAVSAAAGFIFLGRLSFLNFKKTLSNTEEFKRLFEEKTRNAVHAALENKNPDDIPRLLELAKSIKQPELAVEIGQNYNLSADKIQEFAAKTNSSIRTIFADAPEALGGIPKKIQYYCYLDEPRGHLYNWMTNPENKFTKIIFVSFTLTSALGYLFKQTMDAVKEAAVMKENAKTDLTLKKRLAGVELKNFQAKKECAVNPLIDEFKLQAASGSKSPKELKQLADNILKEIKSGPPYVFG